MIKVNKIIGIVLGVSVSLTAMANDIKPLACNAIPEIRNPINTIAPDFNWQNPGCQIVATKSIFPKTRTAGKASFEKGIQVFVYQDKQLKFICLPGWVCKRW